MKRAWLVLRLTMMGCLILCLNIRGEEPSLPPPVLRTAPNDGETIEAHLPYDLYIAWYLYEGFGGVHLQISKDIAFTTLIRDSSPYHETYDSIRIYDEGTYYIRLRREDGNSYSEWLVRSFTLKRAKCSLTVDIFPKDGGTVTFNPEMPEGGYVAGTTVYLTATAATGFRFGYWSYRNVHEPEIDIIMNRDLEVEAVFLSNKKLTIHINPLGAGIVVSDPVMPPEGYAHGTDVVLTVSSNKGYKFVRWDPSGSTSTVLDIEMTENRTVAAIFETTNVPGEGEVPIEGEVPVEGEDVPDDGDGACGGCGGNKAFQTRLGDWLGDWFLIGVAMMVLAGARRFMVN